MFVAERGIGFGDTCSPSIEQPRRRRQLVDVDRARSAGTAGRCGCRDDGCRHGVRRRRATGVPSGDADPERRADVCRPQYVLLAGGVGDRLAAAAVPVAAPPLVRVGDRLRSGPAPAFAVSVSPTIGEPEIDGGTRSFGFAFPWTIPVGLDAAEPAPPSSWRSPARGCGSRRRRPARGTCRSWRLPITSAVGAVSCTAVGRAAEPPVRERHRRGAGPRARARGQEPAVRGVPRDPGLAGVCRSSVCPRRSRAGQHRSRHSGNDGEWSNSPEQRSCVSRAKYVHLYAPPRLRLYPC